MPAPMRPPAREPSNARPLAVARRAYDWFQPVGHYEWWSGWRRAGGWSEPGL